MALERTLSREYYLSEEIFAQEKERIFARGWFCAGREEELPRPGDYLVLDIAGESILVVRTRGGALHAHYNVCRHRGCRLVLGDCGKPANTLGRSTTSRQPFVGLNAEEQTRHKGQLLYPNCMLSLSADHVAAFTLWPHRAERTTIVCDFLFHPSEMAKPDFDPSDAVEFWDLTNRQDWTICEGGGQRGMRSRVFQSGCYTPLERWSRSIRQYIEARLGEGQQP